eukprot:NODE_1459_length_2469_cov_4.543126.p1 GENE.NODE_1459_length_2469_cov_4.543126~~NODE_1459_length_2469_cov_4.543126.p1  ORF type:complete len:367 (+),score=29.20 NODE_1459_length_2469_cov_4.543126:164-1264(+)
MKESGNMAWAVPRMQSTGARASIALRAQALHVPHGFDTWLLTNLVRAMAHALAKSRAIQTAIPASSPRAIEAYTPQSLNSTAWALAALRCLAVRRRFSAVGMQGARSPAFDNVHVSIASWAFSLRSCPVAPVARMAVRGAHDFTVAEFAPTDLSNTAWAMAGVVFVHQCTVVTGSFRLTKVCRLSDPQRVAPTAWCTPRLEALLAPPTAAVSRRSLRIPNAGQARNIANTPWRYAPVQLRGSHFGRTRASGTPQRSTEAQLLQLTHLAWSMAALLFVVQATTALSSPTASLGTTSECSLGEELSTTPWAFGACHSLRGACFAWFCGAEAASGQREFGTRLLRAAARLPRFVVRVGVAPQLPVRGPP